MMYAAWCVDYTEQLCGVPILISPPGLYLVSPIKQTK